MAMRKTGYITILLTGFLATLLLGSCSTDDVAELPLEEGVPVLSALPVSRRASAVDRPLLSSRLQRQEMITTRKPVFIFPSVPTAVSFMITT